jgi:hypothetical protein
MKNAAVKNRERSSNLIGNTLPLRNRAQTFKCYVKFEVLMAVTMKNPVLWDKETQFVLHRGHITSPLQSPAS